MHGQMAGLESAWLVLQIKSIGQGRQVQDIRSTTPQRRRIEATHKLEDGIPINKCLAYVMTSSDKAPRLVVVCMPSAGPFHAHDAEGRGRGTLHDELNTGYVFQPRRSFLQHPVSIDLPA
jgi:hypothetical protein